jgi:hypothetical protein
VRLQPPPILGDRKWPAGDTIKELYLLSNAVRRRLISPGASGSGKAQNNPGLSLRRSARRGAWTGGAGDFKQVPSVAGMRGRGYASGSMFLCALCKNQEKRTAPKSLF